MKFKLLMLLLLSGTVSVNAKNRATNSGGGDIIRTARHSAARPAQYVIQAGHITAPVDKTMYGIFFEDINMAADGGVYAELVKNRSFEFSPGLMGWSVLHSEAGRADVISRINERPENPHFITLTVYTAIIPGSTPTPGAVGSAAQHALPARQLPNALAGPASLGLANEGFRGMGIKAGETYNFSVIARQHAGSKVGLYIELAGSDGKSIGHVALTPDQSDWKRYHAVLTATETVEKAHLIVWAANPGSVDLDMISLFPEHTWKNRPGGLRADLVQKLADLKPGFLRFPGGCIVEGRVLSNRYQWKKSIGDIDQRENIINRWNTEFKHRLTTDYYQTFGLGFFEYFQTAEDIGAEPLPILNCGMACQFNSGQLVPMDDLDPFVQDALDLVEFANGGTDTKWGKLRADLGHPAPFNLKMMGVGNEQWGPQYVERWRIFEKALKTRHPEIKLISSVGPSPEGKEFHLLDSTFRSMHADILDEHYYKNPQWFLDNVTRYDHYDRKGPKIFAGEYAAQSVGIGSPDNKNNWQCAMSEAAFMTGLERNAGVVTMASYAPLFAHTDGWQWTPDLIWFDNLRSYATPNYYVQQLYSLNKGTDVVPLTLDKKAVTGQDGVFASAVLDSHTHELIIKCINTSAVDAPAVFSIKGHKTSGAGASLVTLQSDKLDAVNSLDTPDVIIPVLQTIPVSDSKVTLNMKRYSMNIIRVKLND